MRKLFHYYLEKIKFCDRVKRLVLHLPRSVRLSAFRIFTGAAQDEMDLPPFHAYITNICKSTGHVPEQVIKQAGIERTYGHQLFNGTRKPSRDKVIQLAFGFKLDLDGAQKLLQIAQKSPLYPKIRRDAVIVFCINHRKDLMETQSVLHSLNDGCFY